MAPGLTVHTLHRSVALLIGVTLLLGACASPAPSAESGGSSPVGSAPAARTTKTLQVGTLGEPQGGMIFGGGGNMAQQIRWIFHVGLTNYDDHGALQPLLAQKIPSLADGDWQIAPDGTMAVTWKLKPNLTWHDGTPFTADDYAFGIQVAKDPTLGLATDPLPMVQGATATDASTLVIHWSKPYFDANVSIPQAFAALPKHILGDVYAQGDAQGFLNNPYWSTAFVGVGPFKLTQWMPGADSQGVAFEGFALGRPKIDRVVVRYFRDAQALVAAMLAGDVDYVGPSTLKMDDLKPVQDTWGGSGGTVIASITAVVEPRLQFRDPTVPWAGDVRVRQALIELIDRQTLADTFEPWPEGGVADVFVAKTDPVFQMLQERGYPRYPYDPQHAAQLLADAGWRKGADGVVQNAAGQHFRVDANDAANSQINIQYGLSVQDQWRKGGLDSENVVAPGASTNQNEIKANINGMWIMADPLLPTYTIYKASQIPTAQNKWIGSNITAYNNPEFERLNDAYSATLDLGQRQSVRADLLRFMADQLFFLPLFYAVGSSASAHRSVVRGPTGVTPSQQIGAWNLATWDMN
jgi:peptide/nickel transport system substrate-binding protein